MITETPLTASEPQRLEGQRWKPRNAASWTLRAVVLLVPLGASIGAGLVVSGLWSPPSGALGHAIWYGVTFLASLGVLVVVDRFARRLLPLALLLRLSLVFPDQAPSRLGVALRAGSAKRLAALAQDRETRSAGNDVETVVTLAAALNAHDRRTRGHSERVRALTELVGAQLEIGEEDSERLRWAALLHDIGKLSVPAKVLNKPGKLDNHEFHLIKRHPGHGEELAVSLRGWLGDWVHGIGQHHERYDGKGYPSGLQADDIAFSGRIVAVTDAFETMTAVRSYNKPKSASDAREELTRCAGTHFDPAVVRAFLQISLGRLRWRLGLVSWLAQFPIIGIPARAGAQMATTAAGIESGAGSAFGAVALAVAGVATPIAPAIATAAVIAAEAPVAPSAGNPQDADRLASSADAATPMANVTVAAESASPVTGPSAPSSDDSAVSTSAKVGGSTPGTSEATEDGGKGNGNSGSGNSGSSNSGSGGGNSGSGSGGHG